MDRKYLKYTVEDFTQDIKFINWVTKGTGQKEWNDFIQKNPDCEKNIQTAKKIVLALRYTKKDMKQDDILTVYQNIETFYNLNNKSKSRLKLRKFMQYAALFILVLSIGAAIPIIYYAKNQVHFSETQFTYKEDTNARLITSGGKEILFRGEHSDLELSSSGNELKIDQDSIVRLDSDLNQMAELVVPYGKRSNIELSDGTKVWLNAGSKLIFPQKFSGKYRKVYLKGEGYFEVTKNKDFPFIVNANQLDVKVYGTKFNVNNFDSDVNLEVVLVEGEVGLKENSLINLLNKEIKLAPNQRAVFNKNNNLTKVESNVNVDYYTSWTQGILEFNRQSILFVFDKLSRYYNVEFVTEGKVELSKKISGKLDLKDSLETVMNVISDAAPISFKIQKDQIFVYSNIKTLPMQ
ncbi:FecR family protein [Sunxiuqinia sp. A32]|uniref:FecR family protein n=1 Tax=Sunxiuqinia sp. A32 TaxID=3461496 RepID=UPI0040466F26